jgi:hypothetical protein
MVGRLGSMWSSWKQETLSEPISLPFTPHTFAPSTTLQLQQISLPSAPSSSLSLMAPFVGAPSLVRLVCDCASGKFLMSFSSM